MELCCGQKRQVVVLASLILLDLIQNLFLLHFPPTFVVFFLLLFVDLLWKSFNAVKPCEGFCATPCWDPQLRKHEVYLSTSNKHKYWVNVLCYLATLTSNLHIHSVIQSSRCVFRNVRMCGCRVTSYFIAVTEHRGEDSLQQRQDVFVRLEQAAHRLQLHHSAVRTFSNWDEHNEWLNCKFTLQTNRKELQANSTTFQTVYRVTQHQSWTFHVRFTSEHIQHHWWVSLT